MARTKQYNETEVVEKAMNLFWKNGYETTSMQMLEKEMGINKFSIYSSFGNKHGLFLESLKLYKSNVSTVLDKLKKGTKGIEDIKQFFYDSVSSNFKSDKVKGCFVTNTYNEFSDKEDELIEFEVIKQAVEDRIRFWQLRTSSFIMKKMGRLDFWLEDLDLGIRINFSKVSVEKIAASPETVHIIINSQPLYFAFSVPFGFQSLGVSGRYRFASHIKEVPRQWKFVRIISSLANADLFLGWRMVYDTKMIKWMWSRRKGLLGQIKQQFKRFLDSEAIADKL